MFRYIYNFVLEKIINFISDNYINLEIFNYEAYQYT